MSLPERSEGGSRIYRYDNVKSEGFVPPASTDCLEQITAHIEKYLGDPAYVYHELVSEHVHIDVHMIWPTPARPFITAVTSGMSDLPMTVPPGAEKFRFAELMICLPPDWPTSTESFKDNAHYWPIRLLKFMARFPHQYKSWFGPGHTLPNGNPPVPFDDSTQMNGALLDYMFRVPQEFHRLVISEDKVINFYGVFPVHPDEMDLKLNLGSKHLREQFKTHHVTELLDPKRPSVVAPPPKAAKPWWKLF